MLWGAGACSRYGIEEQDFLKWSVLPMVGIEHIVQTVRLSSFLRVLYVRSRHTSITSHRGDTNCKCTRQYNKINLPFLCTKKIPLPHPPPSSSPIPKFLFYFIFVQNPSPLSRRSSLNKRKKPREQDENMRAAMPE